MRQPLAGDDFASVFKAMLVDVNQSQQQSTQLAASFERGQQSGFGGGDDCPAEIQVSPSRPPCKSATSWFPPIRTL
jgi:hypothetical protein